MSIFGRCCSLSYILEKPLPRKKNSFYLNSSQNNNNDQVHNHYQNYRKTSLIYKDNQNQQKRKAGKDSQLTKLSQTTKATIKQILQPKQFQINGNNSSAYDHYFISDNSCNDIVEINNDNIDKNRGRSQSSNFEETQFKLESNDSQKQFYGEFEIYYDRSFRHKQHKVKKFQQNFEQFKSQIKSSQLQQSSLSNKLLETFQQIPELNNANESDCEIVSIDDEPEIQEPETRYTSQERFSSNLMKRITDSLGRSADMVNKINSILQRQREESSVFVLVCNQSDEKEK